MGKIGSVKFLSSSVEYVLIHTRPDRLTFSSADAESFITRFNITVLAAGGEQD